MPSFLTSYPAAITVPICRECRDRIRASKRLFILGGMVSAAIAGGILYPFLRSDPPLRLTIKSLTLLGLAIIAAKVIPDLILSPCQFRTVDHARAIFRIKFRSEQFTEMVRRNIRNQEDTRIIPKTIPLPTHERVR